MFYSITLSPVINQLEITLERRLIKELTKPEQRQEQLGSLPAKPHNWYDNGSFLKVSLNMELGIVDRDGWMDIPHAGNLLGQSSKGGAKVWKEGKNHLHLHLLQVSDPGGEERKTWSRGKRGAGLG